MHGNHIKLIHQPGNITFTEQNSLFCFLPTGDIDTFTNDNILINDFIGTAKEGSANNIWLRIYKEGALTSYPLLGIASSSSLSKSEHSLKYYGCIENIHYSVIFTYTNYAWFWDVALSGNGETVDLIYGQDVALGEKSAALTNELYLAQYLGHTVFDTSYGYAVCSRQNQQQGDKNPYLQQGMLTGKVTHYSTDAYQFFGTSYKGTHIPQALQGNLECRVLQLESPYIALQSESVMLKETSHFTFYTCYKEHHAEAISVPICDDTIAGFYKDAGSHLFVYHGLPAVKVKEEFGSPFTSLPFKEAQINNFYPVRKLEERNEDTLLSFFTPSHAHIVLQEKELLSERPHGNIIITKVNTEEVDSSVLATTHYMYGFFGGQTVLGNTTYHKFNSVARGLFNQLKYTGQRLFVRIDGYYRMLTLPAAYEAGIHYSRWFYQLEQDTLMITCYTTASSPAIVLEVSSINGEPYDFILTNQLVMGEQEFHTPIILETKGDSILVTSADALTPLSPKISYSLTFSGVPFTVGNDSIFFKDGFEQNSTLLTVTLHGQASFQCILTGCQDAAPSVETGASLGNFQEESQQYMDYFLHMTNQFSLKNLLSQSHKADILNETVWWYTHNALIHFASPHGLEQSGGAAWGTRDISQGPLELFLTTQNYPLVRSILLNVFAHQSYVTKEWPQWFMFDSYTCDAGDCHGDVVLWPLKCIADYLLSCGDYSILQESVPFTYCNEAITLPLLTHIKMAVETIEARFLRDTYLISYAGGDWDDTLQPANEELKQNLVSSWTQALAFQVLTALSHTLILEDAPFADYAGTLAQNVKEAFDRYLMPDQIIAGFVYRTADGSFKSLLHPQDTLTGIQYRLLPMTRSIIADLVSTKQAFRNKSLITEKLSCPDGIRLMDRPARYDGGVSHLFRRAEQAANVGREISLQYTHAHIRYIEAMCHMGCKSEVWDALFKINPILIQESVPNACLRQSNMYFSSSDGAFADRYDYCENFHKLYDGSVPVKGGWRLYSSGPGIYLHQLISHVLGIRFSKDRLIIDPILPPEMDQTTLSYICFGKVYEFVYHVPDIDYDSVCATCGNQALPAANYSNPFGRTGIAIPQKQLEQCNESIHIWLKKSTVSPCVV